VKQITPAVLAALVGAMTPQEVINHLKSLEARGALRHEAVKALVDVKLERAQRDTRVSALKAKVAAQAVPLDAETAARLSRVADEQVRHRGRIKRSTAPLVDKSGSMTQAIEVGKQIAALISGVAEALLKVYAFDSAPFAIEARGDALSDWDVAFAPVRADGNTSIGCALEDLRRRKVAVEQIVIVTDEGENTAPYFVTAYDSYKTELGVAPDVFIVSWVPIARTWRASSAPARSRSRCSRSPRLHRQVNGLGPRTTRCRT